MPHVRHVRKVQDRDVLVQALKQPDARIVARQNAFRAGEID